MRERAPTHENSSPGFVIAVHFSNDVRASARPALAVQRGTVARCNCMSADGLHGGNHDERGLVEMDQNQP
jgi:hypothetical protein